MSNTIVTPNNVGQVFDKTQKVNPQSELESLRAELKRKDSEILTLKENEKITSAKLQEEAKIRTEISESIAKEKTSSPSSINVIREYDSKKEKVLPVKALVDMINAGPGTLEQKTTAINALTTEKIIGGSVLSRYGKSYSSSSKGVTLQKVSFLTVQEFDTLMSIREKSLKDEHIAMFAMSLLERKQINGSRQFPAVTFTDKK